VSASLGAPEASGHGGIWRDLRVYAEWLRPEAAANRATSLLAIEEDRHLLGPLLQGWHSLRFAPTAELSTESHSPTWQPLVLLSTRLSPEVLSYVSSGGAAILLCGGEHSALGCRSISVEGGYLHSPQAGPLKHSLQIDHYWLQEQLKGELAGPEIMAIPV